MTVLASIAGSASAQILSVDYSNDITWKAGSAVESRAAVVSQTPPAAATGIDLGSLPTNATLRAFTVADDGAYLFALDTTVDLPGSVHATPRDVVRYAGGTYSVVFTGETAGVPDGVAIDGLWVHHAGGKDDYYLSFDVTANLGGVVADRRDVVVWDGSAWSKAFDGVSAGVPPNLTLDALSVDLYDPAGVVYYLSFDGSGKLGGVDFDDEDVVAWNGTTWSLAFDASSAADATFASGDLDAEAVRTPNIFRDGFESDDTSQWSQ